MNILIRFEDRYGCKTLFSYSQSCLVKCDIVASLGNTGVFNITKRLASSYDFIICVFDLDSMKVLSLTRSELEPLLQKIFFKENCIKSAFSNKIILIPVYFCYETLTLYSNHIKKIVQKVNFCLDSEAKKLVTTFKKYYDICNSSAESITNFNENIVKIIKDINEFLNNKSTKTWYPQTFYKSYSKNSIKLLAQSLKFLDDDFYKDLSDSLFEKDEDLLFNWLTTKGLLDFPESIISGLSKSNYNKLFYKILTLNNLEELNDLVLEKNLESIYKNLDNYNLEITNKSLELCNLF